MPIVFIGQASFGEDSLTALLYQYENVNVSVTSYGANLYCGSKR